MSTVGERYKSEIDFDETLGDVIKRSKVVFVSEDGIGFDIYLDGKLVCGTQGITIKAGGENAPFDDVRVTANFLGLAVELPKV